jgi:hypothetical protein
MEEDAAIPEGDGKGGVPVLMGGASSHPGVRPLGAHALETGQEKVRVVLYLR